MSYARFPHSSHVRGSNISIFLSRSETNRQTRRLRLYGLTHYLTSSTLRPHAVTLPTCSTNASRRSLSTRIATSPSVRDMAQDAHSRPLSCRRWRWRPLYRKHESVPRPVGFQRTCKLVLLIESPPRRLREYCPRALRIMPPSQIP